MSQSVIKVLVVEDDPSNIVLLETRLVNLGCECLVAAKPEEGLAIAKREQPTLVLLDLRLGYDITGGLWLLSQLREDPETTHIPVFIHSIYIANRGDMPGAEALADGFLLKPFKFDDLKRIIEGFRVPAS